MDVCAFDGVHCESTATGTLLLNIGISLSEPMIFGLGQGLGFIYWNMKGQKGPFIGGRIKPGLLTKNIAKNLDLVLEEEETSSEKKAWMNVQSKIESGHVVGLKLDCYDLEYFTTKIHFAAHYVAIYGYDQENAFLVDTRMQGGKVRTSLNSLTQARSSKGPMSSRNLYFTLRKATSGFDLEKVIPLAIRQNAYDFLNPPISNFGYKGIGKASNELLEWVRQNPQNWNYLNHLGHLMENGGTGGSIFRNLYCDFLKECENMLSNPEILIALSCFEESASLWKKVSGLFQKVDSSNFNDIISEACNELPRIRTVEKDAMEILCRIEN